MIRAALRRVAKIFWAPPPPWVRGRVFEMGGGWGDRIQFMSTPTEAYWRVVGWKDPLPAVDDVLRVEMQSGRMMVCRFRQVEPCRDPDDMFFATVEPIEYEAA